MLATMRTTASSLFMKALLLLLVVAFAVWGVGDVVRAGGQQNVATVGEETITYPQLARAMSVIERTFEAMGMRQVDRRMVQEQALRRMVEEKLIAQRLNDAGFAVGEDQLATRIASMRDFHDIRGKFDAKLFQATLAQRRIGEKQMLDEVATDIRAAIFAQTLGVEAITPPPTLAAMVARSAAERRSAVIVTVSAKRIDPAAISEQALGDYYDANKDARYLAPEQRDVQFVTFSKADLDALAEARVTDEALREAYEAGDQQQPFEASRAALAESIKADFAEQAINDIGNAVEDAMAAGKNFGESVAEAKLHAKPQRLEQVEQNAAPKNPLQQAVVAQAYMLQEGELSNIQTTPDGSYYLVYVDRVVGATPKPFEAVKSDVAQQVAASGRDSAVRAQAAEIKAALEKNDWRDALRGTPVTVRTVNAIARPEIAATPGVPSVLAEAMFQHPIGGVAGPLVTEQGDALLARVTERSTAQGAPALNAKAEQALTDAWRAEISQHVFRDLTHRYPVQLNEPLLKQIMGNEGA